MYLDITPRPFSRRKLALCLMLSAVGAALFLSPKLSRIYGYDGGPWRLIDSGVYFFFLSCFEYSSLFASLTAFMCTRYFDVIALALAGLLYLYFFWPEPPAGKRRMLGIGLTMIFVGGLFTLAPELLGFGRHSPALYYSQCVGTLADFTDLPAKIASADSFPSDHGMVLVVLTGFLWRYFGRRGLLGGCLLFWLCTTPRFIGGAHWFSDIYAGSLGIGLLILPWLLLTPVSDRLVTLAEKLFPLKAVQALFK